MDERNRHQGARVYASASDLFCLTKYQKGWDLRNGSK